MRSLLLLLAVWLLTPAPLWAMQAAGSKPAAPQGQPATPQGQPPVSSGQPATPPQPSTSSGQPPASGAPAAQAPPAPPAAPPENYTYDPAGRRDPFLDLLSTGNEPRVVSGSRRGEGAGGLSVGDISVRGLLQSRGGFYAMVQGPDGKTYMMHPGDKLLDGTVKSVNAEGLVIVQEVNDPLSLVKEREITKKLRSIEAKE
jgi:type IV pilus assembly protein PilP